MEILEKIETAASRISNPVNDVMRQSALAKHTPRILVVAPYATVAPHFETELELVERHLNRGDAVSWLACTGGLSNCDFNPSGDSKKCHECALRRQHGWSLLGGEIERLELTQDLIDIREFSKISDIETLKKFRYRGFDVGYAVLSSLVSVVRDPAPDLNAHRELLNAFFLNAVSVYETVRKFLSANPVDRVYVFNGRFAAMRAAFRAAEHQGVDCQIHERGASMELFQLYDNHLPHDLARIHQRIEEAWEQSPNPDEKHRVGEKWFRDRRDRVETNWLSFTKGQETSRLPTEFAHDRHNVVIFNSSDDEFVAIGDSWQGTLYSDQLSGVRKICESLQARDPAIKVYLRMHPNLIGVLNEVTSQMRALEYDNLTILPPEDPVDTYALMDAARTVVTFGSSTGIEAVYWGRPSVLLGPCFYEKLGGTYQPHDHDEVVELLSQQLEPLDSLGALKYGYWMGSHGIKFDFFEPESWYHGRFKGEVVYAKKPKLTRWQKARVWLGLEKNPQLNERLETLQNRQTLIGN